jgi:hypothetical protein
MMGFCEMWGLAYKGWKFVSGFGVRAGLIIALVLNLAYNGLDFLSSCPLEFQFFFFFWVLKVTGSQYAIRCTASVWLELRIVKGTIALSSVYRVISEFSGGTW